METKFRRIKVVKRFQKIPDFFSTFWVLLNYKAIKVSVDLI
jgi:hypothetical protein